MRTMGQQRRHTRLTLRRAASGARASLVSASLLAVAATAARAQQLPPSLPLTEAFGAPVETGGAAREAVVLTVPFASLWKGAKPKPAPAPATSAPQRSARVDTGLRTSWAVGANVEMAEMHAKTGNAAFAAPLLGNQGSFAGKPRLSGNDSYILMGGQRAPLSTVGVDLSYGLTDHAGRGLSIGTSVGMARYAADSERRVPIGTTHLKLSF